MVSSMGFIETSLQFEREFGAPLRDAGLRALMHDLPVEIQQAVLQSGIEKLGGDFAWLGDTRIQKALCSAHAAHHGQTRKYGGESRLIHEIWCAHRVYNNKDVQQDLAQRGLDAILGAFSAIIHDIVENERDWATKHAQVFDTGAFIGKIEKLWGNPAEFAIIRAECIDFMTDAENIPGNERIPNQRAKGLDADGNCNLTILQQALRMYDKLHHIVSDVVYCAAARKAGHNVSALAAGQLQQAEEKSFPLAYPIAAAIRPEYQQAMNELGLMTRSRSFDSLMGAFIADSLAIAGNVRRQIWDTSTQIPRRLLGYNAS